MTWLTRAERFCEGRIAEALDRRWILGLLRRLRDIGEQEAPIAQNPDSR